MLMAGGSAQAKCEGEERGSAARPRALWMRGGEGEAEGRRREKLEVIRTGSQLSQPEKCVS